MMKLSTEAAIAVCIGAANMDLLHRASKVEYGINLDSRLASTASRMVWSPRSNRMRRAQTISLRLISSVSNQQGTILS